MDPLRILVVATKTPWPPVDGGRLVLLTTIEALAAAGHEIELVAPHDGPVDEVTSALERICTPHIVRTRPRSRIGAAVRGFVQSVPATVTRHTLPAVAKVVDDILATGRIDVIHAEQLHALPQTRGAASLGIPVVHRAHNVESLLWTYSAGHRGPAVRALLAHEARRMSEWEVQALQTTACTVALTEPDRRALSELEPGATIHTVPAPFSATLPAGGEVLDGEPAVTTLASSTWAPSRDAVDHLAMEIWPVVRRRLPKAVLHIFGADHHLEALDGLALHSAPADSQTAFPDGAVVVIPERHPTGVPMKALEAWARGLPLLVDAPTAEALDAADGHELLIARDAGGYADALERLATEDGLARKLVNGGRQALAQRHNPATIADHLTRIYRWAMMTTAE